MEYSCFDGFLQRSWDELLHISKFSNLYKSHVFFVFSYAKRMVNLMWRCIRGFLTANWIGPATFRRGYAMIRPLKFDIDTQHSHSWKGNTSFPNYYFQYSSEISRVYVLQLIYPRSTNHHFWNTKNAKRHEGESLLVIVFDGHSKRIETHYSNWITLASMVESKQCLKSPPAALFYFMSYEKQHNKSCNLLQLHVVEKLYTTLGPQNHEQWRFYTPNNIWVIAPKHKGFTWGTPMVTARSLDTSASQGGKLPQDTPDTKGNEGQRQFHDLKQFTNSRCRTPSTPNPQPQKNHRDFATVIHIQGLRTLPETNSNPWK